MQYLYPHVNQSSVPKYAIGSSLRQLQIRTAATHYQPCTAVAQPHFHGIQATNRTRLPFRNALSKTRRRLDDATPHVWPFVARRSRENKFRVQVASRIGGN